MGSIDSISMNLEKRNLQINKSRRPYTHLCRFRVQVPNFFTTRSFDTFRNREMSTGGGSIRQQLANLDLRMIIDYSLVEWKELEEEESTGNEWEDRKVGRRKDFLLRRMELAKHFIRTNIEPKWISFLILYHKYKEKPWFIPSNLLLFNLNINPNFSENQNIKGKHEEDEDFFNFSPSNSKQYFELKNQNNIEESLLESIEKLQILIKGDFPLQLRWTGRLNQLNQKMMNNIQIYGLLVSLINVRKISISYIQRKEMNLDIMRRRLNLTQLTKKGILIMEPARLSVKNDGQFFMYQIIGISLVHKSKHQSNQRYRNPQNVAKNHFDESIPRHKTLNRDKKNSDLLVPEKILSSRRRRELRILISFNLKNQNNVHRKKFFCKENKIKNWSQFWMKVKILTEKKMN
ncbi:hypothetical protein HanPSC8_Chr13g0580141 [Helianthus annuus]|nr:hypothetical protein HanPSC8_Chr13g0580141 [Helianthus annuus]